MKLKEFGNSPPHGGQMGGGALQQERGQYSARQSGRYSGQPARHPRRPGKTGGGKAVFFVLAAGLCACQRRQAHPHQLQRTAGKNTGVQIAKDKAHQRPEDHRPVHMR